MTVHLGGSALSAPEKQCCPRRRGQIICKINCGKRATSSSEIQMSCLTVPLNVTFEYELSYFPLNNFWTIVCKMVRAMLSDHCRSCPVCDRATLTYCGQTVGWINMPLATEVDLGPGHIMLDGDPARPHHLPPKKGGTNPLPKFSASLLLIAKQQDGLRRHLVRR